MAPNKDDQKVDTAIDAGQVATTPTTPAEKEHKGPILKFLTNNGNSARDRTPRWSEAEPEPERGTGTGRPTPIKDAVKQAGSQLKEAADDVRGGLKDAADSVKKALGGDKDTDKGDASGSQLLSRCGTERLFDSLREQLERATGLVDRDVLGVWKTSVFPTMTGQRSAV